MFFLYFGLARIHLTICRSLCEGKQLLTILVEKTAYFVILITSHIKKSSGFLEDITGSGHMCCLSVYPQTSVFPVNKSVNKSERTVYFPDFNLFVSLSSQNCTVKESFGKGACSEIFAVFKPLFPVIKNLQRKHFD